MIRRSGVSVERRQLLLAQLEQIKERHGREKAQNSQKEPHILAPFVPLCGHGISETALAQALSRPAGAPRGRRRQTRVRMNIRRPAFAVRCREWNTPFASHAGFEVSTLRRGGQCLRNPSQSALRVPSSALGAGCSALRIPSSDFGLQSSALRTPHSAFSEFVLPDPHHPPAADRRTRFTNRSCARCPRPRIRDQTSAGTMR